MLHALTQKNKAMNLLHRLTLLAMFLFLPVSHALAELMLYPTRIIFTENQRSAKLELINNGSESETYRISLVNRRMSETGAFSGIKVPLPHEKFAEDMLRYSPRQVTLAPDTGQMIRIMVRKPANLADGEYRSHLLLAKQPDPNGRTSVESGADASDDEISITLTALVGASIPVIVRHGDTDANVVLTHLDLLRQTDKPSVLAFIMERSGNQSVYGDLTVSFTPHDGSERVVARVNGVAVYAPNSLRRASITLNQRNSSRLADGILRVTYREQTENGDALIAEEILHLP